jgi:hypothetical protein
MARSEYETTPNDTLRFRAAPYWMRTSTSNFLSPEDVVMRTIRKNRRRKKLTSVRSKGETL